MSDYQNDQMADANERAVSRRVQNALTEMHIARQKFLRSLQAGMLTERDKLRFQARILDVYEVLRPYRDRAETEWQSAGRFKNGLEDLPIACVSRKVQERKEVGFGREQVVTREEPQTLHPIHLRELSQDLDDIAKEIGFGPAPDVDPGTVEGGII